MAEQVNLRVCKAVALCCVICLGLTVPTIRASRGSQAVGGLAEARPVCGAFPADPKEVMKMVSIALARTSVLPAVSAQAWGQALVKATGQPLDDNPMSAAISVTKNEHIWANDSYNGPVFVKFVGRLASLTPKDVEPWAPAIIDASGVKETSKHDAVESVVCIDRLFPQEKYDPRGGAILIGRLKTLPPDAVSRFLAVNKSFRPDFINEKRQAALAIAIADSVFPGGNFSEEAFVKALGIRAN